MSDTALAIKEKRSGDILDYTIEYDRWLTEGDFISNASCVFDDGSETLVLDEVVFSDQKVTVWLSGGADGESIEVTVTAETNGGRTKIESFKLRIRD